MGWQDLDRDRAVESRVPGSVDLSHPTCAERREDLVRAQPCAWGEWHRGKESYLPQRRPLDLERARWRGESDVLRRSETSEFEIWCARRDSNAGPLAPEALDGGLLLPTPVYRTRRIRRFRPRPFGSFGMVQQELSATSR